MKKKDKRNLSVRSCLLKTNDVQLAETIDKLIII